MDNWGMAGWKYVSCPKCGRIPKKSGEHTCPKHAWNRGIPMAEEQKKKLSMWHLGRKLSPEHAKKVTRNLEESWKKHRLPEGTITTAHHEYKSIKIGNKQVYLHRYVAEQKLGRKLIKGEEVHHVNFNASDNSPENLWVLKRTDHLRLHSQLELVMKELMARGTVYFENGHYKVR